MLRRLADIWLAVDKAAFKNDSAQGLAPMMKKGGNNMTKLYEKNKLTFALLWIGAYVVLASLADSLSETIGRTKILTVPLLAALAGILYIWISRHKLRVEFGLCKFRGKPAAFLWFLPLGLLLTANLWHGVTRNLPVPDMVLYILSMLLVGFLEEVIFRGLLFKALAEMSLKRAFVISPLTFGIGHIVNLLNGADLLPTILQIIGAVAIGLLFTLLFYRGKSLWPCIITHGIFNSLSVFAVEPDNAGRILSALGICLIAVSYALWLLRGLWVEKRLKQTAERRS